MHEELLCEGGKVVFIIMVARKDTLIRIAEHSNQVATLGRVIGYREVCMVRLRASVLVRIAHLGAVVLEPVSQPAGAAADSVFIESDVRQRRASAFQVDDGVDEGAACLWEVNPIERLSFFQAPYLHALPPRLRRQTDVEATACALPPALHVVPTPGTEQGVTVTRTQLASLAWKGNVWETHDMNGSASSRHVAVANLSIYLSIYPSIYLSIYPRFQASRCKHS